MERVESAGDQLPGGVLVGSPPLQSKAERSSVPVAVGRRR